MLLTLIVCALLAQAAPGEDAKPRDSALAQRIESLFHTVLTTDDAKQEAAAKEEIRKLYDNRGVQTNPDVGDTPAYEFVVLLSDALPFEQRQAALSRLQQAVDGVPTDAVEYFAARLRLEQAKREAEKTPPTNSQLRDEIEEMIVGDQKVRQKQDFDREKLMAVDAANSARLKAILDKYGVPTFAMVGPKAAGDFVVMVQHQTPSFREQALPKLKANVDAGQADPQSYAVMYDRAQRDQGKEQLYGENMECQAGEKMHLSPTSDLEHVNERRAKIGLMRIELYMELAAEMMPANFCPPAPSH